MEITFSEKEDKELFDVLTVGNIFGISIRNQPIASFYEIQQVQKFRSSTGNKVTVKLEKI